MTVGFSPVSPISRKVNVSVLPASGRREKLRPDEQALGDLAEAHDLQSVARFEADVVISKWQRDGVRVAGRILADFVQSCVVTLEPVPAVLDMPFEAVFLPEGSKLARRVRDGDPVELVIDPEGDDVPETFTPPDLDVGAIVEEFFVLALDPFPRSQNAPSEPVETAPAPERESPFAALARLKDDKSDR